MMFKAFKVGTDMWRAETAFDRGNYVDAYRGYNAVRRELKKRNKATFDVDLKTAMAAQNAGLYNDARQAYDEARKGILAAKGLSLDNRNYLLSYIRHWTELREGTFPEDGKRHFDRTKVKKRWLSEFPINW